MLSLDTHWKPSQNLSFFSWFSLFLRTLDCLEKYGWDFLSDIVDFLGLRLSFELLPLDDRECLRCLLECLERLCLYLSLELYEDELRLLRFWSRLLLRLRSSELSRDREELLTDDLRRLCLRLLELLFLDLCLEVLCFELFL